MHEFPLIELHGMLKGFSWLTERAPCIVLSWKVHMIVGGSDRLIPLKCVVVVEPH